MMCTLKMKVSNKLFSSWNQPKCEFLELLLGLQQPSLQTFITYIGTRNGIYNLQPSLNATNSNYKIN